MLPFCAFAELTSHCLKGSTHRERLLHTILYTSIYPFILGPSLHMVHEEWERVRWLQWRRRVSSLTLSLMLH